MKIKFFTYAALCLALFVVFFFLHIPIWFLFGILTIYYAYKAFSPAATTNEVVGPVQYGILGRYAINGNSNDGGYGLYIQLFGRPVFIDIREDAYVEKRKEVARSLYERTLLLESNLRKFIEQNQEFEARQIESIGLHSDDMNRCEVFWNPDGYTLLLGLEPRMKQ